MAQRRVGGIIQLKVNGVMEQAKGNFTWNLGHPVREAVIGADTVHGYKETPQPAFIEGEITLREGLDVKALVLTTDATVTLQTADGRIVSLNDAWYANEGTGNTEEGNFPVRFEAAIGEEIET